MRDLLLNRFRGALLGAVLGEAVGTAAPIAWAQVRSGDWFVSSAADLPQSRRLLGALEQAIAMPLTLPPPASAPTLALLPTALFFHETPTLHQYIKALSRDMSAIDAAICRALSESIALSLQEEGLPRHLLPRLHNAIATLSPPVAEQLMQVQAWLDADMSLTAVQRSIAVLPAELAFVSLVFYGWLSTAPDGNLALLRTGRAASPATAAIATAWVGALAGASGGMTSIAIDWWQPVRCSMRQQRWRSTIVEPIDRQAKYLLAAWSGADQIDRVESIDRAAISAPGLIRPR